MAQYKKIPVDKLEDGMIVSKADRAGVYFPFYGKPISGMHPVNTLKDAGVEYVFIKAEPEVLVPASFDKEELKESAGELGETVTEFHNEAADIPTVRQLIKTKALHIRTKKIAKDLLAEVKKGGRINTRAAERVINDLLESCFANTRVFASMTRLKDFDDYTFTHSLNVSVLSIAIGRRLSRNDKELKTLGLGGLYHDIGKMKLPEKLLIKPDKLSDLEFAVIKKHPEAGFDIARQSGIKEPEILRPILEHHERPDGTGYPGGLEDGNINNFSKIVTIADVYDAITSDKHYHKGWSASEALKLLFENTGSLFNEPLVKFFINTMGVYPIETLVMLDSEELAVVFEINQDNILIPKVLIVTDPTRIKPQPQLFDLSSTDPLNGKPIKRIISSVRHDEYILKPNDVIDRFLSGI